MPSALAGRIVNGCAVLHGRDCHRPYSDASRGHSARHAPLACRTAGVWLLVLMMTALALADCFTPWSQVQQRVRSLLHSQRRTEATYPSPPTAGGIHCRTGPSVGWALRGCGTRSRSMPRPSHRTARSWPREQRGTSPSGRCLVASYSCRSRPAKGLAAGLLRGRPGPAVDRARWLQLPPGCRHRKGTARLAQSPTAALPRARSVDGSWSATVNLDKVDFLRLAGKVILIQDKEGKQVRESGGPPRPGLRLLPAPGPSWPQATTAERSVFGTLVRAAS